MKIDRSGAKQSQPRTPRIPTITFFNNKGGVGKTTLVSHLAWMMADLGKNVLAVDLDPQANLSAMLLDDDTLEEMLDLDEGDTAKTIAQALDPILQGTGDVSDIESTEISSHLRLIVGDLALSTFEDKLSAAWPLCQNRDPAAFRTMTAFDRLVQKAAKGWAELILIDVGPNLGAINRSVLISSDFLILPVGADLFSLRGLRNLGPSMRAWREVWAELKPKAPSGLSLPPGNIEPLGYVVLQHGVRERRSVKAYQGWVKQFPEAYWEHILGNNPKDFEEEDPDPHQLGQLKHYRSLMPMAQLANKPMFFLKPADGAIGAHVDAVKKCYQDFKQLAEVILRQVSAAATQVS